MGLPAVRGNRPSGTGSSPWGWATAYPARESATRSTRILTRGQANAAGDNLKTIFHFLSFCPFFVFFYSVGGLVGCGPTDCVAAAAGRGLSALAPGWGVF